MALERMRRGGFGLILPGRGSAAADGECAVKRFNSPKVFSRVVRQYSFKLLSI